MPIFNNALAGAAGSGGAAGYEIERSLRFNTADSAYLSRGSFANSDTKTMTFSFWLKRSAPTSVTAVQYIFSGGDNGAIFFNSAFSDKLSFNLRGTSGTNFFTTTEAELRDFSAWYHIVVALDLDNATTSERFKCYINGVLQTMSSTSYPNNNFHDGGTWYIGSYTGTQYYPSFYLADFYYIAGQALTADDFGEPDDNGVWQPKAYSGTYGTNGFRLSFSDNTSTTTIAEDSSGNNNDWTANNLSVASGAGNDSLVDSPTNGTQTDTGAGGEVVGNYCTWNPLANTAGALSNGNLDLGNSSANTRCNSTISVSSGKWYYEITLNTLGTNSSAGIGQNQITNAWPGNDALSYSFELDNARAGNNGSLVSYGSALAAGDIFMCAFDLDNNKIFFGKNGTWFNSSDPAAGTNAAFTLSAGSYCPIGRPYGGGSFSLNTGQRAFAYTAPSGFKALCTANLTDPTIADGSTAMDVVTYTGNNSSLTISGFDLSPDFIWFKARSYSGSHALVDIVRGADKQLSSNLTNAESTNSAGAGLQSFNSDGFTLGTESSATGSTNGTQTYAAWMWDAGTSTVSNTDGTITSSVRANPSAGFSVGTYTGTYTVQPTTLDTVGHGLNAAPGLIITKSTSATSNWHVWHSALANNEYIRLNSTNAKATLSSGAGGTLATAPTSSVFPTYFIGGSNNGPSDDLVFYCFAPVEGYSAFGSYTGNGSTDGPFVYTGFRPKWVLVKMSSGGSSWQLLDSARSDYNVMDDALFPNLSNAEQSQSAYKTDFLSNGFKLRDADSFRNGSGSTFIYAAFAENPFKTARAR